MSTNDILLETILKANNPSSYISSIDTCCIHNSAFARTYNDNIYHCRTMPSKHLAIICCIDARLDVYRMLGLQPGGGRIRDAIRSLICSQGLFQTKELMIIHHTDCGFTYFTNNNQILASLIVRTGIKTNDRHLSQSFYNGEKPDFMPIVDIEQSVRDDMVEYKQHPMLDQNIIIRGFLYDTKTGLLKEIERLQR